MRAGQDAKPRYYSAFSSAQDRCEVWEFEYGRLVLAQCDRCRRNGWCVRRKLGPYRVCCRCLEAMGRAGMGRASQIPNTIMACHSEVYALDSVTGLPKRMTLPGANWHLR